MARLPDTPCSSCGRLMHSNPDYPPGTKGRVCHPCRRARGGGARVGRVKVMRICCRCGAMWLPRRMRKNEFCPGCRKFARVPKTRPCAFCAEYFASTFGADHCSRSCSQRARAGWSRSTEIVHAPPPPKPRRVHPADLPAPKRTDWWQLLISGPCRRCGEDFTALASSVGTAAAYCSVRCSRADGKDRARARKREAFVAPVYRRKIFDRDGWCCQLCGKAVNRRAATPHPKAAVLDHIIPLAAGGTHEPSNVQCAHFLCNSEKGDRAMNDQLRLIG